MIDLLTRLHELYNLQIQNLLTVGGINAPKIQFYQFQRLVAYKAMLYRLVKINIRIELSFLYKFPIF
jgi:hypothetical protein